MSHWSVKPQKNPDCDARYVVDYESDTIEIFGNKITPLQIIRLMNHEVIHEAIDAAFQYDKPTTEEQDHFIIEELEASGDL